MSFRFSVYLESYGWFLERGFVSPELSLLPQVGLAIWRRFGCLLTDIHAGIFLRPPTLWQIYVLDGDKPDLVVVGGDL